MSANNLRHIFGQDRYLDGLSLSNGGINLILSSPLSEDVMLIFKFIRQASACRG